MVEPADRGVLRALGKIRARHEDVIHLVGRTRTGSSLDISADAENLAVQRSPGPRWGPEEKARKDRKDHPVHIVSKRVNVNWTSSRNSKQERRGGAINPS